MFSKRTKTFLALIALPTLGAGSCATSSCGKTTDSSTGADSGPSSGETAADSSTSADSGIPSGDTATDEGHEITVDGPPDFETSEDAPDVTADGGTCACRPDFCGCGACGPQDIVCTKTPPTCSLGCTGSCPDLAKTICSCDADRCVRSGIDGAIGCYTEADCPPGNCCAYGGPPRPAGQGICRPAGDPCCTPGVCL